MQKCGDFSLNCFKVVAIAPNKQAITSVINPKLFVVIWIVLAIAWVIGKIVAG